MDAHVFRRLCDALAGLLPGARVEKIQSPVADVHVFSLYAQQRKHSLVLRHDRRNPFLFVSPERHGTGQPPDAVTMRLRKYAAGRRVKACVFDWAKRRIHLCFHGAETCAVAQTPDQPESWITLDLREGPLLTLGGRPEGVPAVLPSTVASSAALASADSFAPHIPLLFIEPTWPDFSVQNVLQEGLQGDKEVWQQWPVLTPALRRVLPHVEPAEQAALLADLESGGGDLFVYGPAAQDGAQGSGWEVFAWPLPDCLRGQRQEYVFEDPLEALAKVGAQQVLGGMEEVRQREAASPHKREAKRLERILQKLEQEEARLLAMVAGKERALYLQEVLWRFDPAARPAALTGIAAEDCPPCPFDPSLLKAQWTLRENMESLFHTAARGARGLLMLEERRALLRGQCSAAQDSALVAGSMAASAPSPGLLASKVRKAGTNAPSPSTVGKHVLPKNVESFVSVDGLLILRGRDAKGNLALLKVAAPHDLWMHVEGGPGAHTIVRRAFAGQEIPVATLEQSATLAAVKSWQKGNEKVCVQCAQVRHVKAMRGVATGTVRVDKVERTLWVEIPSL